MQSDHEALIENEHPPVVRHLLARLASALLLLTSAVQAAPLLGLGDAVEITLSSSPSVELTRSTLAVQQGAALEASGAFDPVVSFSTTLTYIQQELTERAKQQQRQQREDIQTAIEQLRERRESQEEALRRLELLQADPGNTELIPDDEARTILELLNALIEAEQIDLARLALQRLRDDSIEDQRATVAQTVQDLTEAEEQEIERLRLLGPAPEFEHEHSIVTTASYRRAYRNGWVLETFFDLSQSGNNFKGKPADPERGGRGVLDLYRSRIGARVRVPLARGRSVASAAEQVADLEYQAASLLLEQQVAGLVLGSVQAYWDLVAASLRRDILQLSSERQRRLVTLGEALVVADQVPRSELTRIFARQAEADAALIQAEDALSRARLQLAQSMGLRVSSLADAPLPADAFPSLASDEQLAALEPSLLLATALSRRQDLRASAERIGGARLSAQTASLELASRHDLDLELSYSGVAEGSSIRRGLNSSVLGRWSGPSASFGYSFERVLGNHAARGQWQQREALLQQQLLLQDDLERQIRASVLRTVGSLIDTVAQASALRAAVDAYTDSIGAEREKLQLGTATVIDLVLTEERLTGVLLNAVAAERSYAGLLAQLHFESGQLLQADGEGGFTVSVPSLLNPPQAHSSIVD